jgi:hypothetical protein
MRVLLLISDTGGGHRSAAVAVEAALQRIDPSIEIIIRDALVEKATWPFSRSPWLYTFCDAVICAGLWALGFALTNGTATLPILWPM